jgi:hypothetical protein
MQLTAFAQKKLGDLALGVAAWTMPSVYLALFASSPGENGSLASEVSGGSYARVALTAKMGAADAVTGIAISTSVVTFPAPSAAQGVIAWAGIVDASSSGNVLAYTPLGIRSSSTMAIRRSRSTSARSPSRSPARSLRTRPAIS